MAGGRKGGCGNLGRVGGGRVLGSGKYRCVKGASKKIVSKGGGPRTSAARCMTWGCKD